MIPTQMLNPRDVVSYLGRDYIVEGVLTYKLNGKTMRLARAVDGAAVKWVEPLSDDLDDRLLVLEEVSDLPVGSTPPPASISYRNHPFVPRVSGLATVEVNGKVPLRSGGPCEVWRFRAPGDIYLQIEALPGGGRVVLFGESVNKGMIDVLPGQ